jgi:alpha-1,6-mannosyltransferase
MTHAPYRQAWSSLLAGLIAICYLSIAYTSRYKSEQSLFIFLTLSGLVFLAIYLLKKKFILSKKTVFAWAIAFHAIGFIGLPLFEDDHYRYLWDGYRAVETGSPYGIAPEALFDDDSVPKPMQQVLSGINNPEVPTIYGPALQAVFSASYLISPGSLWPIKLFLILANLMLVLLLLKKATANQVMLYAWNPLVFKEIALTAHSDGLLALVIFAAWLSRHYWQGRLSGIIFGIALAVKISVLPALAWLFWKRQFTGIVLAIGVFLFCYFPFLSSGSDWQGFKVFANEWEFNSGIYALAKLLLSATVAKILCVAIAGIGMLWVMKGNAAVENPPWHRLFGILLLFSPVINAWYLLWFLALAVMHQDRWPWWASAMVLLSYVTGQNLGNDTLHAFDIPTWVRVIEWGIVITVACFDITRRQSEHLFASNKPLLY